MLSAGSWWTAGTSIDDVYKPKPSSSSRPASSTGQVVRVWACQQATAASGYSLSMTTKIAVSLPDDLVVVARLAVAEGRATSVSAFVADALEEHGRYADLTSLLAEMAAEAGPPTAEDRAWARQALGLE